MGFGRHEMVNDVTEAAGHTYVATNQGILESDGAAWRRLAVPRGGVRAVVSVRAIDGGELFAIGNVPNPTAQRWQFLIRSVPLLLSLAMLAVPIWTVRRFKRYQLSQHQGLQQAVAHATGAVPEEFARDEQLLVRQSSWWSATVAVTVVVGAMVGYWTVRIFWPGAPVWMFLAIALGLHLLATLWQTLVRRAPKPWEPIEPGGSRFDWGPTRRALPASLMVFFLMNVGHFPKWMGDPVLWVLYAFLGFMSYKLIEQKSLLAAIHRGDYEGGLKQIGRFHFYNPDGGMALLPRGHFLLMAGRYREAEAVLRRAVAALRSRAAQGHALEFLGDALMEQGRSEEARRSYEASLAAVPGFRRPYRGMAELLLRRGDATRALECVENVVGPSGPSWNRWTANGKATDDYWALKAWVLAELGRGAEVPPAAAQAIRQTNLKSGPDAAATYRRLGLAMKALNREGEAEEYLRQARDADPRGRWGTLAKGIDKFPTIGDIMRVVLCFAYDGTEWVSTRHC
jgi:tetratricopeptide (TPR) repeat protein